MNSEMTNSVMASGENAQYDTCVKRLLAQKSILAYILINTVDEFKGMEPEEAEKYIEGEPYIGTVPVEPGLTNTEELDEDGKRIAVFNTGNDISGNHGQRIAGLNTESVEINEGLVRYDIIFYVRTRNGLSQIIVNIEAQKSEPKDYPILNRAIFYVSRMISSQKERDFVNTNYGDIKQVFSIWICMNMDYNSLSHIHLVKDEMLEPCNWKGNLDLLNIVMIGVTNIIPEREEKYELHRLISALLSDKLQVKTKLDIMDEYNIPINDDFREDVNTMCNLAEGIEERAIAKTQKEERDKAKKAIEKAVEGATKSATKIATEKATKSTINSIIINMYNQGCTLELIANVTGTSVDKVADLIKKKPHAMA